MPRLYDCFPFFNELDLLELRFNELYDVVDRFVIVEAGETFTGKQKPYHFVENAARFEKFMDKVTYLQLDSFPEGISGWERERLQRDKLLEGLVEAASDDLILLSDIDEIPDARVIFEARNKPPKFNEVYCFEMRWFYYFMNLERRARWLRLGPRMIRRDCVDSMQELRYVRAPAKSFIRDFFRALKIARGMKRWLKRTVWHDAGWHFTWLGGANAVAFKAYALTKHSSMPDQLETLPVAEGVIADALRAVGTDYDIATVDETYPKFVQANMDIYRKYMVELDEPGAIS